MACAAGRMHPRPAYTRSESLPPFRSSSEGFSNSCADVEVFPAFDYARAEHVTTILQDVQTTGSKQSKTVTFHSQDTKLQLDVVIDRGEDAGNSCPCVVFKKVKKPGMLGEGVTARFTVAEGQAISFVLRNDYPKHITDNITSGVLDSQQHDTQTFWYNWISRSQYKGRWREVVSRSLMILKLMTYEPTGAIIASPTFSIPEDIGGVRCVQTSAAIDQISLLTRF